MLPKPVTIRPANVQLKPVTIRPKHVPSKPATTKIPVTTQRPQPLTIRGDFRIHVLKNGQVRIEKLDAKNKSKKNKKNKKTKKFFLENAKIKINKVN